MTLHAYGQSGKLASAAADIPAKSRISNVYQGWFPDIALDDLTRITVTSTNGQLSGIAITGNADNSKMLFTSAGPLGPETGGGGGGEEETWTITQTVSGEDGGAIIGDDGVQVTFVEGWAVDDVTVELAKTEEASGDDGDGFVMVSGAYSLSVTSGMLTNADIVFTVPIDVSMLPEGQDLESLESFLAPQIYDQESGEWVACNTLFFAFDSETGMASFTISPSDLFGDDAAQAQPPLRHGFRAPPLNGAYAVGYNTNSMTNTFDGNYCTIRFWPPEIPSNANWPYSVQTCSQESSSYNFITDMVDAHCQAMNYYNTVYSNIQNNNKSNYILAQPQGYKVPYSVGYLSDYGSTRLGGSVMLSNTLKDKEHMNTIVAHELIHHLQGEVLNYPNFFSHSLESNRWFIEATAQYFSALAVGATDKEKKDIFYDSTMLGMLSYLSESIRSNDRFSYYAAGHFLYWLPLVSQR